MATHSSIFTWQIPCTEDPGGLPSMGSQRVGHDWATNTSSFFCRSFHTALPPSAMHPDGLDLQALGSTYHFRKLALLHLFLPPGNERWLLQVSLHSFPPYQGSLTSSVLKIIIFLHSVHFSLFPGKGCFQSLWLIPRWTEAEVSICVLIGVWM